MRRQKTCFGLAKCDLLAISTNASRIFTGRRRSRTVKGIPKSYGEHCPEYLVMIKTTPIRPRTWRLTIFSRLLRRKIGMSVIPHHRPCILVSTPTAVPLNYWNSNRWTLTSSFSSSELHRTKNCSLDPVPTRIIKQYSDVLAPFIAFLINSSLRQGLFPSTQKNAIITTILKKSNLKHIPCNYRLISNLSFLSKLLELCVNEQKNNYLSMNNLLPAVQSACRKQHSTETAVLGAVRHLLSRRCRSDHATWTFGS